MTVDVKLDTQGIKNKIESNLKRVQYVLDSQVAKDSNYYAPEDVGTLQDSVILSGSIGSGLLEWNTPYARKQYYEFPNKSKDKNPNSRMKWFEHAKAEKKDEWEKLANAEYNK